MSTIERPSLSPQELPPKRRHEEKFKPQNFVALSSFEANGWMVVTGAPVIQKNERPTLVAGKMVNPLHGLIEKAKALFPATIFDTSSYYIAFDTANNQYVVVHKRTPLGESEWERANR